MLLIDIQLVTWNRPKMTKLAIETLYHNTDPQNFRLVVLDNGSEKETTDMLIDYAERGYIDELHLWDTNMGLEAARQYLLFKTTESNYFISMDNDCLPPPRVDGVDWVTRLVELMDKYEVYGAISARTQVMIGTGNIFEEADMDDEDLVDFPHPGGSLRIMNTYAVKGVGGWDAQRPGRGAEERYIGGKLNEAGFKTAFSTNVRCLHLFGTRGDNPTDRWGYDKDLEPSDTGHNDISHPALTNGDDYEEVSLFSGEANAKEYFKC